MPSDKLRDDMPGYQEPGLTRTILGWLVQRARERRAELCRRPIRVRANIRQSDDRKPNRALDGETIAPPLGEADALKHEMRIPRQRQPTHDQ